ncbi:helix-turn-helix domain-containing protein [Streptomyces sp. NPDC001276]|uniref:helix-turn-helix domain-containing protein n=1 Tax=Streptomyces sp. NPDC001276 TaxID=3364555 RepID=UPI003685F1FF
MLATRFKKAVGQGPHEYLTAWRFELAAKQLRRGERTVSSIAHAVGYGSDSALSTAFKRVMGPRPGTTGSTRIPWRDASAVTCLSCDTFRDRPVLANCVCPPAEV